MKTNTKKQLKASIVTLCALLLIFATILGTLAYLTDTKTVTNTFTVGNVQIKLDEAEVTPETGKKISPEVRVPNDNTPSAENSYKILPGRTIDKDPTVTVLSGSEECYVRVLVTVSFSDGSTASMDTHKEDIRGIFTGHSAKIGIGWTCVNPDGNLANNTMTFEYRYSADQSDTVNALNAKQKLPAVFSTLTMPTTWTSDDMATIHEMTIVVTAHAIQAEGFANADDAWIAFNAQP